MMYEKEERKVRKLLSFLVFTGRLDKKNQIVIFGACENSKVVIKLLRERGFTIRKVVDNDRKKNGKSCSGIQVEFPDVIQGMDKKTLRVFFYSYYGYEIESQLEGYGLKKYRSFYPLIDELGVVTGRWYGRQACRVLMGLGHYWRLKKKYGEGSKIFVCPYTGTGDIYLAGAFFKQYSEKNKIESYVWVVVSTACKKTAQLFEIGNIEQITKEQADRIIKANVFAPELCDVLVVNDSWASIYTNPTEWLRGYKGLTFTDMFRYAVFGLEEQPQLSVPDYLKGMPAAERFLEEQGMELQNTVILSPYSNTLPELPGAFWEELAKGLKRKSYQVVTNSCGVQEPAVKGTKAVFFPLDLAVPLVSRAGGFIGVRSGLCDIISSAAAKKVVIYEKDNYFYQGTTEEYFSLKRMGLCQDVVELFYQGDIGQTIGQVLAEF